MIVKYDVVSSHQLAMLAVWLNSQENRVESLVGGGRGGAQTRDVKVVELKSAEVSGSTFKVVLQIRDYLNEADGDNRKRMDTKYFLGAHKAITADV